MRRRALFERWHAVEQGAHRCHTAITHNFHSFEIGHPATSMAILLGERLGLRLTRHIRNSYRQPMADGSLLI